MKHDAITLIVDLLAAFGLGVAVSYLLLAREWRKAARSWGDARAEWQRAHDRAVEAQNISRHNIMMFEQFKTLMARCGVSEQELRGSLN